MSKNILLARPHPFIVAEMKPFLEENGYLIIKLDAMANLPVMASKVGGAIISLALSSSLPESAEAVLQQLRQTAPGVPVVFASILSFDQARPGMERLASQCGIKATFVGIDSEASASSHLGRAEAFLYFSKNDLATPTRRVVAARMLKRHFNQ